jgi:hypothetical protein
LAFVSANPSQGSYSDLSGVWDVGTLAPGSPVTLEIVATVGSLPSSNTASVTHADQFDPNPANNSASADLT